MILGIDLGTSNSLVGYYTEEGVSLIKNEHGDYLTPSVVHVDETGMINIGKVAKEKLVTHPENTASAFKRDMGTKRIYHLSKNHRFNSIDLSALILKSLKSDAESFLKTPCEEAIISVPAYFNNLQREATLSAAKLAGLKVKKLISEPTAAALAYGIHEFADDAIIAVVDLGGGTFDISIMEMFDGVLQVLAIAGDNQLGGEDFTHILVSDFLKKNGLDENHIAPKEYSKLINQCELLKQAIIDSSDHSFSITLNKYDYTYTMNLDTYKELCLPLLIKLRTPITKALKDANIRTSLLHEVILMGGATKSLIIQEYMSYLFEKPLRMDINPDETIAVGAVLQGALWAQNKSLDEILLTDVCGFTLGISTYDKLQNLEILSPIINRNTTLPTSQVQSFWPTDGDQAEVLIQVFQGEHYLTNENLYLGDFSICLPRCGEDQEIQVRFTYDISGILEIECTIVETGSSKKLVLNNYIKQMSEKEISKRLQELEKLKIHPKDVSENQYLMARGERYYELSSHSERKFLLKALLSFREAIETQDPLVIKKARMIFEEKLDAYQKYLENVFL